LEEYYKISAMFNFKCDFPNIYGVLQLYCLTLYYNFYWILNIEINSCCHLLIQ
jgi:hypothetical protein